MAVSTPENQLSFSIIDPQMTVLAMRDSGYISTTHALAELIDNSIESCATVIEVFGVSRVDDVTRRFTLKELAVLDNGAGMDATTLRGSLRYGHGTRRERRGIGRFGFGLPNSSMSQARRVDIWSWQSGATNALHTRLALADVEGGASEIPEPTRREIPKIYREASRHGFGDSGTLVVWSDLDRVEWKRASTTFIHTENLIGRLYRRFLAKKSERLHPDDPRGKEIGSRRAITLIPIQEDNEGIEVQEADIVEVRPNDPLYLMTGTSCPEDFGPGPMFTELKGSPFSVRVSYRGEDHEVRIRASYARAHVRDSSASEANWPERWIGQDAGNSPWGKHAAQNMGVSLIRAHREIHLDDSWISGYDPRDRWWKVEVDFPTALDEVFGVTNNKQGAMTFQRLSRFDWRREALPGEESVGDVSRRMEREGDSRAYLIAVQRQVQKAIDAVQRRALKAKQSRTGQRHALDEGQKADAKVTAAIKRRMQEGHEGASDKAGESGSEKEHEQTQIESLTEKHQFDPEEALQRIHETIRTGSRVRWIESARANHSAFFDVESLPGVVQVSLNTDHPVYSHLYEIMRPDLEDMTEDQLRERLARAAAAFHILIYSWARYEEEQSDKPRRQVRNARVEWGKYAEDFFDGGDDSAAPTDLV